MLLGDGRTVGLRPVRPEDGPLLEDFYSRLSFESRRFRFFSGWRVDAETAADFAAIADRGGFAVLAVAEEDGVERVVGDVRWTRPSQVPGVPEMAIAIRDDYQRSGLGRVLLDVLASEAWARGITTFAATLLTANLGMRRLIEDRGFAVVDHDDPNTVQVIMGTDGDPPPWPVAGEPVAGERRPRVLVEGPGWWGREDERLLRHAGYDVLQCLGPRRSQSCPLLAGDRCPLVEGADAVVLSVPPEYQGEMLEAAHAARTPVPVVVRAGGGDRLLQEVAARIGEARQ